MVIDISTTQEEEEVKIEKEYISFKDIVEVV
jgi:hypothetical protein